MSVSKGAPGAAGPPLYVIGAGATARDAVDILHRSGQLPSVRGFVVQGEPAPGQSLAGIPVVGERALDGLPRGTRLADAIASPLREPFVRALQERGFEFVPLVHPNANVHPLATLGKGCLVQGGVSVGANATIHEHVVLNWNCLIGHDSTVEPYAHVSGGALVGARTRIGRGATLGLGVVVLEDRVVGASTLVGAMSLVTRDLPEKVLAYGQPAKPQRPITPGELADLVAHRRPPQTH